MSKPKIQCLPNGPYKAEGFSEFNSTKGPIEVPAQAFLCRCGGSKNKPFCDGTHAKNGFTSDKEEDRVADKGEEFSGEDITVTDNRGLCAHAGYCTNGAPTAFRQKEEPFVDPDGAPADEVKKVIKQCPSGAINFAGNSDDGAGVFVAPNGPYAFSGDIELEGVEWLQGANKKKFTLCRCGASKNKPFCNGAHWNHKFDEES